MTSTVHNGHICSCERPKTENELVNNFSTNESRRLGHRRWKLLAVCDTSFVPEWRRGGRPNSISTGTVRKWVRSISPEASQRQRGPLLQPPRGRQRRQPDIARCAPRYQGWKIFGELLDLGSKASSALARWKWKWRRAKARALVTRGLWHLSLGDSDLLSTKIWHSAFCCESLLYHPSSFKWQDLSHICRAGAHIKWCE